MDDLTTATPQRASGMWRRIRWGAADFCVVQVAVYAPLPGLRAPAALLSVGLVVSVLLVAANLARRRSTGGGP